MQEHQLKGGIVGSKALCFGTLEKGRLLEFSQMESLWEGNGASAVPQRKVVGRSGEGWVWTKIGLGEWMKEG